MNFDEQDQLPTLLPLRPKKIEGEGTSKQPALKETLSIFQKQNSIQTEKDIRKSDFSTKSPMGGDKIPEFDQTLNKIHDKSQKRGEKQKRINNTMKQKQAQISKQLIEIMMKKINGKNISQEIYPVTNETVSDLIKKLDQQIADIKFELDRKKNSLLGNNANTHLKKQIESSQSTIDKCLTIKQLYNDKISLRNRISSLEQNIIDLKSQNFSLKIKINRGIQTIQNHMHNLPCQKQKALLEELSKSQTELRKEKQMRVKLENEISMMVLNFKRLYEQADTARMIVNNKLKELQKKQISLMTMPQNQSISELSDRKYKILEHIQEKKMKKVQFDNSSDINLDNSTNTLKKGNPSPASLPYNLPTHQPSPFTDNRDNRTKNRLREQQKVTVNPFFLEDQIKKMRSNQIALSKTQNK